MGLLADLGIEDPKQIDADAAEAQMATGGVIPPGIYHAMLESVRQIDANSGSKGIEFKFCVLAGPHTDAKIEGTIWLPNDSQTPANKKKSQTQCSMYGHRLGLLKKLPGADGKNHYVDYDPPKTFPDAVGVAVLIEVKSELEQWKDDKGNPRSMMKAKLTYEGVLSPDDKKVKDALAAGKLAVAGAAAVAAAVNRPVGQAGGGGGGKENQFIDL